MRLLFHAVGRRRRVPYAGRARRRTIALLLVTLAAAGCRSSDSGNSGNSGDPKGLPGDPDQALAGRIDQALSRASAYLLTRQGEDGAFRSDTYAAFKDGYSLTPLVLTALLFAPRDQRTAATLEEAYRRGVDFVATLVTGDDALRVGLDGPRYPTYAITGAILVLNVPDNDRHAAARQALVDLLRARQLTEERGWQPDDVSYGGWGYYAGIPDKPAGTADGQDDPERAANLSATLFAIGALHLGGVPPDDPAMQKARVFVERCQNFTPPLPPGAACATGNTVKTAKTAKAGNPGNAAVNDGGFFFSPAVADANKAGKAGTDAHGHPRYRSYGSMTADGLRALLRLGVPADDPRVQAAAGWLETRFTPARNPGDFEPRDQVRQESAYYYYVWSSAHALRAMGKPVLATAHGDVRWAAALATELLDRQRPDGTWANDYTELREDDPLLATAFAMAGLANARMALTGTYDTHGMHRPPRRPGKETP